MLTFGDIMETLQLQMSIEEYQFCHENHKYVNPYCASKLGTSVPILPTAKKAACT